MKGFMALALTALVGGVVAVGTAQALSYYEAPDRHVQQIIEKGNVREPNVLNYGRR
jgi:hypothetical protein